VTGARSRGALPLKKTGPWGARRATRNRSSRRRRTVGGGSEGSAALLGVARTAARELAVAVRTAWAVRATGTVASVSHDDSLRQRDEGRGRSSERRWSGGQGSLRAVSRSARPTQPCPRRTRALSRAGKRNRAELSRPRRPRRARTRTSGRSGPPLTMASVALRTARIFFEWKQVDAILGAVQQVIMRGVASKPQVPDVRCSLSRLGGKDPPWVGNSVPDPVPSGRRLAGYALSVARTNRAEGSVSRCGVTTCRVRSRAVSSEALEEAARLYESAADELEQAAQHCRTAARHFHEREVPRAAAHAWAALGHVLVAEDSLQSQARTHAEKSTP
jgi:hypothetical protein